VKPPNFFPIIFQKSAFFIFFPPFSSVIWKIIDNFAADSAVRVAPLGEG
jgi:hypothetical protein